MGKAVSEREVQYAWLAHFWNILRCFKMCLSRQASSLQSAESKCTFMDKPTGLFFSNLATVLLFQGHNTDASPGYGSNCLLSLQVP